MNLEKYKLWKLCNFSSKICKNNSNILNTIEEDIYFSDILSDLKSLDKLDKNSHQYKETYNKVINVGEFTLTQNNH